MKNPFLLILIAFVMASCSSTKRSTGTTAVTGTGIQKNASSPAFLNNITINPGNNQQNSVASVQPAYAGEKTGSNVEMSASLQFKYAILLDVPVEEVTDQQLIEFIEGWYGTRYRYGGNDKNGIDCSAFAQTLMGAIFSIRLPRTSIEQYNQSTHIKREELQQGDLVFFATLGKKQGVSHVGVYLRNNKFVHASTTGGVMIDDLNSAYYSGHFAGAGRMK